MTATIGFFHTVAGLAETFDELTAEYAPEAEHFHVVDESVLDDALEIGKLTPSIRNRICTQLSLVEQGGADVILDTCSSTSPAVDVARELVEVPILKIDDPMTDRAVELGDIVGVLATAESTLGPSTGLVASKADQQGKDVAIESLHVEDALDARTSGDVDRHDELVREDARALAGDVDVLVLAQASMAHLQADLNEELDVPVLSSPDTAMERIAEIVDEA